MTGPSFFMNDAALQQQLPASPPVASAAVASEPASRFVRRLKLGIAALNLMVFTLLALTLYDSRQHLIAEADITANNLTGLLATNLANVFGKIDQSLLTVVDKLNDDGVLSPDNRLNCRPSRSAWQRERLRWIAWRFRTPKAT